jgi:predicted dehydrogenase
VRQHNVLTVQRTKQPLHTRTYEPFETRRAELDAFADAVAGVAPYPVTPEEAIAGSAALEAIALSAELGQEVSLA